MTTSLDALSPPPQLGGSWRTTRSIALLSLRQGLRQPVTWLATAIGLGLLAVTMIFGMFSFSAEDRIRLVMSSGIATVKLMGLFLGLDRQPADQSRADGPYPMTRLPTVSRHHYLIATLGSLAVAVIPCCLIALVHLGLAAIDSWGFDFYQQRQTVHQFVEAGTVAYGRLMLAQLSAYWGPVLDQSGCRSSRKHQLGG